MIYPNATAVRQALIRAGVMHDLLTKAAVQTVTRQAGPGELLLEGQFAQEVRPGLADLYDIPRQNDLGEIYGESRAEIKKWVMQQYREDGEGAISLIAAVLAGFGLRAYNLGGQWGLNELELLAEFDLTDQRIEDRIIAETEKLSRLNGKFSLAKTTAGEIAVRLDNQYQAGYPLGEVTDLFSAWSLGRTIIRSATIAADQTVKMSRWGLASAFVGNGIKSVMHICEADVVERCTTELCPPLCGNIYRLRGVISPMSSIPATERIPLHPYCRCSYDPIKEGWVKPAVIWTGFAL